MGKAAVALGAGVGVAGGSVLALVVKDYLEKRVPDDIVGALRRFGFIDRTFDKSLTKAWLVSKGYGAYHFFVGIEGYPIDDILIELGRDEAGNMHAVITKLAWNAIDVYLDGVLTASLPAYVHNADFGGVVTRDL